MKFKKYISIILIFIVIFNFSGCKKQEKNNSKKELNIYIDIKDNNSLNVLKMMLDEYKKNNPDLKLNVSNAFAGKVEENLSKQEDIDIIFTSRNKMIKLSKKGLLDNMDFNYEKYKLNENYYSIVNAYGRFKDKYYGIPLLPYTVEFLYNEKSLKDLGIEEPKSITDVKEIFTKLNASSKKIPVMLPEDLDINTVIFSIIANNKVNSMELENIYGKEKEKYLQLDNMQEVFKIINESVKSNAMNKNSFEVGNDVTINKFNDGEIPFLIATSYYNSKFKSSNIKSIKNLYDIDKFNNHTPVLVNCIMSISSKSNNQKEVYKFLKFMLDDKTANKILEKGLLSNNKKINDSKEKQMSKINKYTLENIKRSNENSIFFVYNIDDKFKSLISSKVDEILLGKYTGDEWKEIVDDFSNK